jgi:hypothetical protein
MQMNDDYHSKEKNFQNIFFISNIFLLLDILILIVGYHVDEYYHPVNQ